MLELKLDDAVMTQRLGKSLGQLLPINTVLLLDGELGAGKTTLVQGIGLGLGITEPIVSPTFAIAQEYFEGRIPLYHIDLYRLTPAEISELYLENYWEAIEVPPGVTVIEWACLLPYLPASYLAISLKVIPSGGRLITIEPAGDFSELDLSNLDCSN
ncbi:MAG: tRNA (adenosine(37)-N6)-threonylcarbamoyltransferase complex ATPase subunit type 1 TsaE [Gloeocapsa sp. DLM2.Bin57]|nr:MAG: tRNA (adenosine(37)-N6)-threonylcarbamoyltransferase complex ATPase subunit type 1 TsaE [Gloeocapsa sp. DLM2.Bin57]